MRLGIDAVPFAYEQTGIGRYLGSVLEEMQNLDASFEYLLYSPLPVVVPMRGGNWGVRVVPRGLSQRPSIWAQTVLPGLLASDRVDAFWGQPTNLPLSLRRRCLRILTIHDLVAYVRPESMRRRSWLRTRFLLKPIARVADAIAADSIATKNLACKYLGISEEQVTVVYAAAQREFRPISRGEATDTVGRAFGLLPNYVLSVGTIEPRKDHLTLLRAFERIPNAPVLVLAGGAGWRCGRILERIKSDERDGRVVYLGRVRDELLPALYSAARFSVYPSLYEGFGLPVLESMACGCPVLCSDSSCLPEVGGTAASYFRTGSVEDLSRALASLLSSTGQLDVMSVAGIARAEQFSYRRAAEEMLRIVREGLALRH
jgi:glycosyltransferase involved in cell wall biosynthesis